MARVSQRVNYYNFSGGKVSDTNPLTPPENVARKLLNVDLQKDGSVTRRLGLAPEYDFKTHGEYSLSELRDTGFDLFVWTGADFDAELNFTVVRSENTLLIFHSDAHNISGHLLTTIDITRHRSDAATTDTLSSFQMASGKGLLVCSGTSFNPFYVKYDSQNNSWSDEPIEIRVRDFEGVDDGFRIDERRASNNQNIPPKHLYNLLNQGWSSSEIGTFHYENERYGNGGIWPANGDNPILGRVHDGKHAYFQPNLVTNRPAPNGRAPNGRFIIDPFDTNTRSVEASRYAPAINVGGKVTLERPKSVAFYAGRFFYGSVDGTVFYSQIIESEDDLGKCYQENDPTSEDFNQLLDTDGGTLKLMSVGTVEKMAPLGNGLVVLGSSGVYYISGGVDTGFTANNQQVAFVSNVTTLGYRSVVQTNQSIVFWSDRGIFEVVTNELGAVQVRSISEYRIGRDFDQIPLAAKTMAQGCFNSNENKVYWSYSSEQTQLTGIVVNQYTEMLILDMTTGAFYDYKLSDEGYIDLDQTPYPIMIGSVSTAPRTVVSYDEVVTDSSGEEVWDETGDAITVQRSQQGTTSLTLTMGVLLPDDQGNYRLTFGKFSSNLFKDWDRLEEEAPFFITGKDYKSEVETLPSTLGEPSIKKQTPFVYTYYGSKRGPGRVGGEYPLGGGEGDGRETWDRPPMKPIGAVIACRATSGLEIWNTGSTPYRQDPGALPSSLQGVNLYTCGAANDKLLLGGEDSLYILSTLSYPWVLVGTITVASNHRVELSRDANQAIVSGSNGTYLVGINTGSVQQLSADATSRGRWSVDNSYVTLTAPQGSITGAPTKRSAIFSSTGILQAGFQGDGSAFDRIHIDEGRNLMLLFLGNQRIKYTFSDRIQRGFMNRVGGTNIELIVNTTGSKLIIVASGATYVEQPPGDAAEPWGSWPAPREYIGVGGFPAGSSYPSVNKVVIRPGGTGPLHVVTLGDTWSYSVTGFDSDLTPSRPITDVTIFPPPLTDRKPGVDSTEGL